MPFGTRETAVAWQVGSLLLDYPGDSLSAMVPVLQDAVAGLPERVRAGFAAYLSQLAAAGERRALGEVQSDYVDTFDVTRKCAMHLTYFTHGDTRRRGVALVQVKQAYRRAGVEFEAEELPDFLPVVLEFGALHDLETGWDLLVQHRVGVELLRRALDRRGSRWLPVLDAVRATLPPLGDDDELALARLIAEGPPSEDVGLDTSPYAFDPRLDPRMNPRPPGAGHFPADRHDMSGAAEHGIPPAPGVPR